MGKEEAPETLKSAILYLLVVVGFLGIVALWTQWVTVINFDTLVEFAPGLAGFAFFGTFLAWIILLIGFEASLFPDEKLQKRYKEIEKKYSDYDVQKIYKKEARYYHKWEKAKQKVEEMKK